jgi:hypothetical protein
MGRGTVMVATMVDLIFIIMVVMVCETAKSGAL